MSDLLHVGGGGAKHLPPIGRSDHQCLLLTPKKQAEGPPFLKESPAYETREFVRS